MNSSLRRFLTVTAVIGVVGMSATLVQATPIIGNYQGSSMFDGRWSDSYAGGGAFQISNPLKIGSWDGASLGSQWMESGAVLSSIQVIAPVSSGSLVISQFVDTYTGGVLNLEGGPWTGGGDGNYLVNLSTFVVTRSLVTMPSLGLTFPETDVVTLEGAFVGQPGYRLNYLSASTTIDGHGAAAWPGYPSLSAPQGQWGAATGVQMQIVPEPATLALLALGAMGMVVRRRRRK